MKTKLNLTIDNREVTIEQDCGETLDNLMQDVIIPALLAQGFAEQTINHYLEGEPS